MDRKLIILLVVGGIGICLCGAILAVALGLFAITNEPSSVEVSVDAPANVPLNERFEIIITIENITDEEQTLDSIDIEDSYLEGLSVELSEPPFSSTEPIPLVAYQTYTMQHRIPAGSTVEVRFLMVGEMEGKYGGDIDVCINLATNCLTRTIVTEVGGGNGR